MTADGGAGGNTLYFGDCLQVMREDVASESVDLVYLDPPFNSKRLYNAFMGGAQWVAFADTWRWAEAVNDWHEVAGKVDTAPVMEALRTMLGEGAMLAYLAYMANRLVECRRVLKPTGSIYLHCDPTASHYLKVLMDAIFGAGNFRNEVIWKRTNAHGGARRFGPVHDTIFFYTKTDRYTWNRVLRAAPSRRNDRPAACRSSERCCERIRARIPGAESREQTGILAVVDVMRCFTGAPKPRQTGRTAGAASHIPNYPRSGAEPDLRARGKTPFRCGARLRGAV